MKFTPYVFPANFHKLPSVSVPLNEAVMATDPLDKETAVSVEVTPNGAKAKTNSRAIAAVDRLLGNAVDWLSIGMETRVSESRAKSEANIKLIEATTEIALKRLECNPEFAARALESHFNTVVLRLENKQAVVTEAVADLRDQPPTAEDEVSGGETLDETFLNRFERYAEDASTDELRAKWGKVLASEIRRPGTFSSKVMRIIDELDADTALIFQRVCQYRVRDTILKCLSGELPFYDYSKLVTAGLFVEQGMGQHLAFSKVILDNGDAILKTDISHVSAGIPEHIEIDKLKFDDKAPITQIFPDSIGIPVYVLTGVGCIISKIIDDSQEEAISAYFELLSSFLSPIVVLEFRNSGDGYFKLLKKHQKVL